MPRKEWFKENIESLRLVMICLLVIYVALLSWIVIPRMPQSDSHLCQAMTQNNEVLSNVVRKAYTPIRPDLLSPEMLKDLEQRKVEVLRVIEPPNCEF